jgi:hypothetical protein
MRPGEGRQELKVESTILQHAINIIKFPKIRQRNGIASPGDICCESSRRSKYSAGLDRLHKTRKNIMIATSIANNCEAFPLIEWNIPLLPSTIKNKRDTQ